MKSKNQVNYQLRKLKYLFILLIIFFVIPNKLSAHQQPTSIVLLDVSPNKVAMELQIPLSELELAFGHDVTKNTETLVARLQPQLKDYLLSHIQPISENNQVWSVEITDLKVADATQTQSGNYQEIIVHSILTPPIGVSTRRFNLNYDVILHQVVTHKALVSIRTDWETGTNNERPIEAGAIFVDTATTKILPLEINLENGSLWHGFHGMLSLGMQHIKQGTDHLLFLLVLLLPATLLVNNKYWGEFGGTKYSVLRLLKIVTAFTVGHSLTLLIGALGWLQLPQKPVEILIAVSILVSAIHAIKPIFAGKEIYIAAGFGLVHGLAFATVLANLHLASTQMALSILGFNIGIELMQIFVIALIVPWLILLSQTQVYKSVRIIGAFLSGIAAISWIVERVSGESNAGSEFVQSILQYAHIGLLVLAIIAVSAFGFKYFGRKNHSGKTE